jgi:hypothetical protein
MKQPTRPLINICAWVVQQLFFLLVASFLLLFSNAPAHNAHHAHTQHHTIATTAHHTVTSIPRNAPHHTVTSTPRAPHRTPQRSANADYCACTTTPHHPLNQVSVHRCGWALWGQEQLGSLLLSLLRKRVLK